MGFFFPFPALRSFRRDARVMLASAWVAGLILGAVFSLFAGDTAWMRGVPFGSVSIVGVLASAVLPLFFSAFAVYVSAPYLLLPVVFCKAFLFSWCGVGIASVFGDAGWLICGLLLFTDISMLPVLWLFWLRCCRFAADRPMYDLIVPVAAALLVGSMNYSVISPFLAGILS